MVAVRRRTGGRVRDEGGGADGEDDDEKEFSVMRRRGTTGAMALRG